MSLLYKSLTLRGNKAIELSILDKADRLKNISLSFWRVLELSVT